MRETWRRLVIAWQMLRGALLRVPLIASRFVVQRALQHLDRYTDRHRVRRIDVFLNILRANSG